MFNNDYFMVSKLRDAKSFYELQSKGKIAKPYSQSEKLNKDNKGFYLNKRNSVGEVFKQRVKNDDRVYTRSTGVTLYSSKNDKSIVEVDTRHRSTPTEHSPYAHMSDRNAKSTNRAYKE